MQRIYVSSDVKQLSTGFDYKAYLCVRFSTCNRETAIFYLGKIGTDTGRA